MASSSGAAGAGDELKAGVSKYDVLLVLKKQTETAAQLYLEEDGKTAATAAATTATVTPEYEFYVKHQVKNSCENSAAGTLPLPLLQPQQQPQPQQHNYFHVGNNRCGVFCKMNAKDFAQAATVEAQDYVLDTVYDIVCNQCIDVSCQRTGKFLLLQPEFQQNADDVDDLQQQLQTTSDKNNNNSNNHRDDGAQAQAVVDVCQDLTCWTELTKSQAHSFLRGYLEREQKEAAAIVMPSSSSASSEQRGGGGGVHNTSTTTTTTTALTGSSAAVATSTRTTVVEDDEKKRRRRSSLLRRSMSGGNVFEDQKKRVAYRQSVLLQLQKFDVSSSADDDDDDGDDDESVIEGDSASFSASETGLLPPSPPPALPGKTGNGTGSVIAPTNQNHQNQNRVTVFHRCPAPPQLERSPSWSEGLDNTKNKNVVVHTANALDVILQAQSPTCYNLVPNHTGNNRVMVMVQLRLSKYMEVTKNKTPTLFSMVRLMCGELVEAIQKNYKGRFLVEHEQADDSNKECYLLLTDEQAAAAIESIFRSEASLEETSSVANNAAGDGVLASAPPPIIAPTSSPSLIKTQTLQQLQQITTSFGVADAGTGDVHKAAIESLQKRKKRQGVSSKISQMVAFNTGNATLLERSQSVGDTASVLNNNQKWSLAPGGLTRFASTGLSASQQQQQFMSAPVATRSDYLPPHDASVEQTAFVQRRQSEFFPANPLIDELDEFQPTDVGLGYRPLQHHHFHQEHDPRRRSSMLSEFSQGMIHDMLVRLEVNSNFHGGGSAGLGVSSSYYPADHSGPAAALAPNQHRHMAEASDVDDVSTFPVSAEAAAAAYELGFGREDSP